MADKKINPQEIREEILRCKGDKLRVLESRYAEYSDNIIPMMNPKERTKLIGKKIAELRKSLRLTQKEVSEYIEIPQQTYAGYESGNHEPPVEVLVRIAFLYKTSVDNVVCMYDDIPLVDNPRLDELIEEEEERADMSAQLEWIKLQIEDLEKKLKSQK